MRLLGILRNVITQEEDAPGYPGAVSCPRVVGCSRYTRQIVLFKRRMLLSER